MASVTDSPPTQKRAHPREQLRGAERLGEVVVRARCQHRLPLRLERSGREDDDRQLRPDAYAAYQIDSIAIRQAEIDDCDVRPVKLGLSDRGGAGTGRDDA